MSRSRRVRLAIFGVLSLVVVIISVTTTRDWVPVLGTLMTVAWVVLSLREEKNQSEPARAGAKSGYLAAVAVILLIALGFVVGWISGSAPD